MKKSGLGKIIISSIVGSVLSGIGVMVLNNKELVKKDEKIEKFRGYYNILNQWLILKHDGKDVANFFVNKRYKTIAIYGMGEIGNRLYEELKDKTNVEIKYAIDKNAGNNNSSLEVYSMDDELENVDVIVVTATFDFNEIEKKLEEKSNADIISIEDVIYEL